MKQNGILQGLAAPIIPNQKKSEEDFFFLNKGKEQKYVWDLLCSHEGSQVPEQ